MFFHPENRFGSNRQYFDSANIRYGNEMFNTTTRNSSLPRYNIENYYYPSSNIGSSIGKMNPMNANLKINVNVNDSNYNPIFGMNEMPHNMNMKSITDWPVPKNVKDLQSFLGLANYYRRFIKDFSKIATPLHRLCSKKVEFSWSDAA